jgi:hypothetical protein
VHPQHAELAQFRRQLGERHRRLLEPLPHVRHDLVADEGADGVADIALLVGEERVKGEVVAGADRWGWHALEIYLLIDSTT